MEVKLLNGGAKKHEIKAIFEERARLLIEEKLNDF